MRLRPIPLQTRVTPGPRCVTACAGSFGRCEGSVGIEDIEPGHEQLRSTQPYVVKPVSASRWARESVEDEDLEVGFRQSPRYLKWKCLLHHVNDLLPVVEPFELVEPQQAGDALRTTDIAGG